MFRELIIINVLLVFLTSVCAIYEKDNQKSNGTKIYLNKCCSAETYVGKQKTCVPGNINLKLNSKIKVYDEDITVTGKSFEDLFTVLPDKFNDTKFNKDVLDVIELDHNVYLTESGVIQVELPNAYDRWTAIPIDSYCIDVSSREPMEPRFWAVLPIKESYTISNIWDSYLHLYLTIGKVLSCFFMLLVLVVYFLLPDLRNLPGLIQMACIFSLFMAFLILFTVQIENMPDEACVGVMSGIYFFFLAAFCWMSVMSYDVWWTFRTGLQSRQHLRVEWLKFVMYCLYAWGVPLLMTIGLVVVNSYRDDIRHLPWFVAPRIPESGCFLEGGVKLLYLYMPMLILIICNWLFYLMTAFNIWRSGRGIAVRTNANPQNKSCSNRQKQRLEVYLKLSVVMGLSWLLEIVSFLRPAAYHMWAISDVYNSLIGLLLFLIFVCNKNTRKKLCKRFRRSKTTNWSTKSTSRSKVDSSQESIALEAWVSSQPCGLNE